MWSFAFDRSKLFGLFYGVKFTTLLLFLNFFISFVCVKLFFFNCIRSSSLRNTQVWSKIYRANGRHVLSVQTLSRHWGWTCWKHMRKPTKQTSHSSATDFFRGKRGLLLFFCLVSLIVEWEDCVSCFTWFWSSILVYWVEPSRLSSI